MAVAALKPDKAPGPDEIPNRVVKLVYEVAVRELIELFTACLRIGYYPKEFRRAITIVLLKLGKSDYSDPVVYRPIALLNTLGKVLESIIARRLSDLAEANTLLPDTQYGARPGRSTETALLNITEQIRAIWDKDKTAVVSILSLDVSKAFDRVSHRRLIHDLWKRRIPKSLTGWISSFLDDRSTSLRIGGYTSPEKRTQVGIPQGSPISPILYLFYNADLVDTYVDGA